MWKAAKAANDIAMEFGQQLHQHRRLVIDMPETRSLGRGQLR
jgi:hypothetical protein